MEFRYSFFFKDGWTRGCGRTVRPPGRPLQGARRHRQMPQVEVNIQTDGVTNAQTDASSGAKYADGDINARTDASSGGKYSYR